MNFFSLKNLFCVDFFHNNSAVTPPIAISKKILI